MPPQDLPPGLYDHPLSEATHQALAQQQCPAPSGAAGGAVAGWADTLLVNAPS